MNSNFLKFRKEYPTFIYHKYDILENENTIKIIYSFEIPNLEVFNPTLEIPKNNIKIDINDSFFRNLVFHIGMIELVSYFKCTCSPHVIIKAGYINEEQINWFKKLYYYGLGEFMYLNEIDISLDDLMKIECVCEKEEVNIPSYNGVGNLIPIGGGKDSVVSLELLKNESDINHCFIINPKEVTLNCSSVGGYENDKVVGVKRTIDKRLIELNNRGFLNGHTPFSAAVAFISYLTAYMYGKRYIVLSNEASANEATVIGTKINHQYSKTYEFENDFNTYTKKYFGIDIKYFSLLRPLSEFQIGMLFSKFEKYHPIFKSCNVGSKGSEWKWCCNCPKCLFVYIILSPFLYKDKLINIFGEDLFENKELLSTFLELLGYSETKPFECVGTYGEVRYAVSLVIKNIEGELPYLLKYYSDNYTMYDGIDYIKEYNTEHNLDPKFEELLKKELGSHV